MKALPSVIFPLLLGLLTQTTALSVNFTDVVENSTNVVNNTANITANGTDEAVQEEVLNLRPIIGILSQEPGRYMRRALKEQENRTHDSYIAASYVKSIESAGARVVPIMINQPDEYYEKMAKSLNGFLFPGGSASITNSSGYGRAGDLLYQHILASQNTSNPLPLWCTCLSFELLVYLAAGRQYPLTRCAASGRADPLLFSEGFNSSRMFRGAGEDLLQATAQQNITSNFHKYCVLPETFSDLNVDADFNVLSTNYDDNGTLYVSTIEHKTYPIFGTQWHPEKPAFEWSRRSIPHTVEALRLNTHLMEVFVNEARRNTNRFNSTQEEREHLIYKYTPTYISEYYDSSFQQCYYF